MRASHMVFLECVLSFAVPLVWALRELYLLRRRPPPRDHDPVPAPRPLPPDMFLAPPPPARPKLRVLEDA